MNELTDDQREVQEAQGWNESTMLMLALRFINDVQQQHLQFENYLEEIADAENSEDTVFGSF